MKYLRPMSNGSWPSPRFWSDSGFDDFFSDFERMMDGFFQPAAEQKLQTYSPACDVSEAEDHYMLSFDLPGLRKEDLQIELKDNRLFISGERRRELNSENGGVLRHERGFGKFQRVFTLPAHVDAQRIEAQYQDGVLNIALPKAEEAKSRTIEIQSGKGGFFSRLLGSVKKDEATDDDVRAS